jgi:hypothetical protein
MADGGAPGAGRRHGLYRQAFHHPEDNLEFDSTGAS